MIAVDMDGVVTNFCSSFSNVIRGLTNGRAPRVVDYNEVATWAWKPWYWLGEFTNKLNERAWKCVLGSPAFWFSLEELFPRDTPLLRQLNRDVPLVFMTRRDGIQPWSQTVEWLGSRGIREPLVVRVRAGEEKHELCRRMGIKTIIDDNPKTLELCRDAGMKVVAMSWPYNKHVTQVWRCTSLGQALNAAIAADAGALDSCGGTNAK